MSYTVEIICLGNELLIGKILNTNAHWLAKYITSMGGRVQRITITGDHIQDISSVLKESLSRTPSLIMTTGGLGPTYDDKTLEAVAITLQEPLALNEEAFTMVKTKYHQYEIQAKKKIELTPARVKMAKLPKNSTPLPNPVGTAPAVLSTYQSSKIINLPGVPTEMKAIFEESVVPLIKKAVGNLVVHEKSLEVTGIIESALAPLIANVMKDNPHVYIKSHPKAAEPVPIIEIHITTSSLSKKIAIDQVDVAQQMITHLIIKHKGKVQPT